MTQLILGGTVPLMSLSSLWRTRPVRVGRSGLAGAAAEVTYQKKKMELEQKQMTGDESSENKHVG